jgi:hypothetical protein
LWAQVPGSFGTQKPATQAAPAMQSTFASAHGKAHLLYWVLQWARPQAESFEHGHAAGPGTAIAPAAGAPGIGGWPGIGWTGG